MQSNHRLTTSGRSQPYVILLRPGKWDSQAPRSTSGEVIS